MPSPTHTSDISGAGDMSVALIGPDEDRRKAVAEALAGPPPEPGSRNKPRPAGNAVFIREYSDYPPQPDDLTRILEQDYDVILLDLDSDPECALNVVKSISTQSAATVMVYSAKSLSLIHISPQRRAASASRTPSSASGASTSTSRALGA